MTEAVLLTPKNAELPAPMKIVMRADASVSIGTGHVMRCLTLAEALRERGAEVLFVCREEPGHCCDIILGRGFQVARLAATGPFSDERDAEQTVLAMDGRADWLIVDHYGIGAEWERRLRPQAGRIMAIDDLANRRHDCDLLLDQNLFDDMSARYRGLAPADCRLFLGPRYALLRDEFIAARRTLRERDGAVRRILLFFGGSDPTNETEKALLALGRLRSAEVALDVVVGSSNPLGDRIHDLCAALPGVTFHRQVANMAQLMARADLALGAGGATTWERCFLGLPSLVVVVAENQAEPARAAESAGVAWLLGESAAVSAASIESAVGRALREPGRLAEMSRGCLALMGERAAPVSGDIMNCLCEVADAP